MVQFLALLVILAAAAAIRLYGLGGTPLWTDEALTLVLAELHILTLWLTPADPTPAVYYTLHKLLFQGTVPTAFQARLPAMVIGVISVAAIYWVGRSMAGGRAGLAAALLLSVHTYHIIYSQQARAYGLLFLLILVSAGSLITYLKTASPATRPADDPAPTGHGGRFLVYYVASAVIALYTHYTTVYWTAFSFAALVLYETALADPAMRPRLWRRHGIIAVVFALATLPALWLITQLNADWTWLTHVSFTEMVSQIGDVWFLWEVDMAALDWLLLAITLFGVFHAWRSRSPAAPVMTALLLVPFALWLTGFIRPMLMERTILFSVSGVVLALAMALEAIPGRWPRWAGLAVLLVGYGTNTALFQEQSLAGNRKQDWTGATRYLEQHMKDGDMVLLCGPWVYTGLRHASGERLTGFPTYGSRNGWLYRMGNGDSPDITWPQAHAQYFYGKVPAQPPSVFDSAATVWGLRVNCLDEEKASYDGVVGAIKGQPTPVWSGYSIIIDRIEMPSRQR